jgi:hypothetical protein
MVKIQNSLVLNVSDLRAIVDMVHAIPALLGDGIGVPKGHIRLLVNLTRSLVSYFDVTNVQQAQDCLSPENALHNLCHECVYIGLSTKHFFSQVMIRVGFVASYGDVGVFHGRGIPPQHG